MIAVTAACPFGPAATSASAVEPAVPPHQVPRGKLLCKTQPQTGSRFRVKTCHTSGQRETIAEAMRRSAQEMNGPAVEIRRN